MSVKTTQQSTSRPKWQMTYALHCNQKYKYVTCICMYYDSRYQLIQQPQILIGLHYIQLLYKSLGDTSLNNHKYNTITRRYSAIKDWNNYRKYKCITSPQECMPLMKDQCLVMHM